MTIDFLLVAGIILLGGAVVLALLAETRFSEAQFLENSFWWKAAGKKYKEAIALDPFDTKYVAGYADFLTRQSAYHKDKGIWLKKAEEQYERAIEMNPRCAEYYLGLGDARLADSLWLMANSLASGRAGLRIDRIMPHFQKAVAYDPNGFNTAYAVGTAGVGIWDTLDNEEKEFITNCLRRSIKIRPWYSEQVCAYTYGHIKDYKLLKSIVPYNALHPYGHIDSREKQKRITDIKNSARNISAATDSIPVTGWHGKDITGNCVYENGNMYWTGTIDGIINMPKGEAVIKISAKGSDAYGVWPYMIVELDGEVIGETFVDSLEWKEYAFRVNTAGGVEVLSVTFANDGGDWKKGIDRNLYIGEAKAGKR